MSIDRLLTNIGIGLTFLILLGEGLSHITDKSSGIGLWALQMCGFTALVVIAWLMVALLRIVSRWYETRVILKCLVAVNFVALLFAPILHKR